MIVEHPNTLMRYGQLLDRYAGLLPDRQREILEYYYYDDYTLSEIAELLTLSRQAVSAHLRKGTGKLDVYEETLALVRNESALILLLDGLRRELVAGRVEEARQILDDLLDAGS